MAATAVEKPTIEKLQSFFNEPAYQDLMRNTARFNVRIRKDRVYRQPYIDGQTGVAQKHCHLFVSDKERMPGILQGQVYTYPARRWRATHRSYLVSMMELENRRNEPEEHVITAVENPVIIPPPVPIVEDQLSLVAKAKNNNNSMEPWQFYEENTYEDEIEDEFESEEDYDDETYNRKGGLTRRRRPVTRKTKTKTKRKVVNRTPSKLIRNIKKDDNDDKPYVCELCGMRYKTRPGLTCHYSHSHKEGEETKSKPMEHAGAAEPSGNSAAMLPQPAAQMDSWTGINGLAGRRPMVHPATPPMAEILTAGPATPGATSAVESPAEKEELPTKKSISASPYCDFCLGDAITNKKTGTAEQLVSCADCGRSGHPTCLQFTDNMVKSVVRYRWQCIECKTCTLCGTSDNDDQLLFCDGCDRGYHLYCLSPPLSAPPEGEWSCYLCLREFHNK